MALSQLSKHLRLLLLLCMVAITYSTQAQQLAFPGAEGFGRFTTGGRGGAVYAVTNLNDSGAGSLRDAVSKSGARTIVFKVSGTISLLSNLNINNGNITIAGQTAPGDGITIKNYPVSVNSDNVIIRYLRFRMGDEALQEADALGGRFRKGIIVDHCSMSWSTDECVSFYGNENFTLQWSIISESLRNSVHVKEAHGYGGIWGGKNASFHHNLLANHDSRNPRLGEEAGKAYALTDLVDLRNNVLYNWGNNSTYGGEAMNVNMVNNYYKPGPATLKRERIFSIDKNKIEGTEVYNMWGKFYIDGNFVEGSARATSDNWTYGVFNQFHGSYGTVSDEDKAAMKLSEPHPIGGNVVTHAATEAYELVLQQAGASLKRDAVDVRIVEHVKNGTYTAPGSKGSTNGIIDSQADVGGWPALQSTVAPQDTDNDGMPDAWEQQNGLNPNLATDGNANGSNGYTNLENYLNSLSTLSSSKDPAILASGSFSTFPQAIGSPSPAQTLLVSGSNLTGGISIAAPANFQLSIDGANWLNSITLSANAGTVPSTSINVRLNAQATGTYSGSLVLSGGGAASVRFALSGTTSTPEPEPQSQLLGAFPDVDGGFENQTVGSSLTVTSHTSTTKWEASSPIQILNTGARTGSKVLHWNGASTSTKYLLAPVLSTPILQAGTPYVVQFWYKKPASGGTGSLFLSGYNSITGGMSGSAGTTTSQRVGVLHSDAVSDWVLFQGVMTTQSGVTVTNTYPGIKVENPQVPFFDIDDYVIYPGSAFDMTAPDVATSPVSKGAPSSIAINWQAPASGVDEGGYLVVRSTSAVTPVPNVKGVYVTGNTMGANNSVVFTGKTTQFTDNGSVAALVSGTTYYYHIFTVDKAFNYSPATSVSGSLGAGTPTVAVSGNVSPFAQNLGTPSASQSFSIAGTSLSANVQVTAPAGFELSENESNWSASLSLAPSGNSVNATRYVRLNAAAAGPYSGNVSVASTGATTATLAVSGTVTVPVVNNKPFNADIVVALDGSGDFTKIQDAIDAVPSNSERRTVIYIKRGLYNTEKLIVPFDKKNVTFIGESRDQTIISYHISDCSSPGGKCPVADAEKWTGDNIRTSATITLQGDGFRAENLTFQNTAGPVGQALAITVQSDKNVFLNCNFLGYQDTIYLWTAGKRSYFEGCLVLGRTDYIYGAGIAWFEACEIRSWGGGWITAPSTPQNQPFGYVFNNSRFTYATNSPRVGDDGFKVRLGRPWHEYPKVMIMNSYLTEMIHPEGWGDKWNMAYSDTSPDLHLYEYNNNGPGADMSGRAKWVGLKGLTAAEAAPYTIPIVFGGTDGWNPKAEAPTVKNFSWTGAGETKGWLVAGNWNPAGVPAAGEAANVSGQHEVLATGGSFPADLHLTNGATLNVASNSTATYLSMAGSQLTTASNATLGGKIATKEANKFAGTGTLTLTAVLTGVHPFTKEGTGTVSLDANNSDFSGSWFVTAGTLEAKATSSLGKGGVTVSDGATLVFGNSGALQPKSAIRVVAGSSLVLNADVTLNEFYIDKVMQPVGEYTATTNPGLISGTGKIIIGRPDTFNFIGGVNGNWDNPAHFSPQLMPVAGETVIVAREIETTGTVFPANIVLTSTGMVRLRGNHKATGVIRMETGSRFGFATSGTGFTLNAPVEVLGDVRMEMSSPNTAGNAMILPGNISGSAKLTPRNTRNSAVTATLVLGGNNSGFTGTWDVTDPPTHASGVVRMEGTSANAFGNGLIEVGLNNKVLFSHEKSAGDHLRLNLRQNGKAVLNTIVRVISFTLGGTKMAAGTYSATTHPAIFEGTGSLVVGASIHMEGATFTYNAKPQGLTAFAYGVGGTSEVLSPEVSLVYKDAEGTASAGAPVKAGVYVAEATFAGNADYQAVSKTVTLTIEKAPATVQATGGTYTYDATGKAASGFASGVSEEEGTLAPVVTFVYKDAEEKVVTGLPVNAGTYTVEASFAGNANYTPASASTSLTIATRPITVAADALTKQWSDPDPVLSYVVEGALVGTDTFTGSLERVIGEELGTYTVNQGTLALSSNYVLAFVPGTFTITKEDARITFTGSQFVNTSCATCTGATVTLSATIQDISATAEAAGDVHPGDISKAKVRFVNRETNTPISGWLSVVPVNNADKRTGTVVYNWATSTGASDAEDYTIGIEVDGYYSRNSAADNVTVMVAKPLNDFVVGAGAILSSSSSGQYAADAGAKIHFAANVKYNKSGKSLQGRVNVIFSRTEADGILHVYQLKGSVMNSLSTNTADQMNKQAVFTGKATMMDVTNPLSPLSVAGNLTLKAEMTDKGVSGTNDGISFTVWANAGGLLLSSNWTGTSTAKTTLSGGNISISGGSVASGAVTSTQVSTVGMETATDKPQVQVYPVPSDSYFTLVLQGTKGETAVVMVRDLTNRKMDQFKAVVGQPIQFGDKLAAGTYLVEILQGGKRTTIKVVKQ